MDVLCQWSVGFFIDSFLSGSFQSGLSKFHVVDPSPPRHETNTTSDRYVSRHTKHLPMLMGLLLPPVVGWPRRQSRHMNETHDITYHTGKQTTQTTIIISTIVFISNNQRFHTSNNGKRRPSTTTNTPTKALGLAIQPSCERCTSSPL